MWTSESRLKGVWHEIFAFRFFSGVNLSWATEYTMGAI
jgi:hypothetical protein